MVDHITLLPACCTHSLSECVVLNNYPVVWTCSFETADFPLGVCQIKVLAENYQSAEWKSFF